MQLRHATLHQLRIFLAVTRHKSFARAAEALHLSPPTLSLQVKQLSTTVGQPLFEQLGKKIFLTEAGQTLADACQDVESRLERLAQDMDALRGIEKGTLKLAILTTLQYTIPKLLGSYCAAHPGIEIALFVGNREVLLQRLTANQDDLYIMGQPPEQMEVACEHFAENPLVLVAPPSHPLVGKMNIKPAQLKGEAFILREPGSGTRLTTERFFSSQGNVLKNRLELGSNEAIKQTVAGGLGVAVLSATTVTSELALNELAVLDVVGLPLIRHWHVVYHKDKKLSAAVGAFKSWLFANRPVSAGQSVAVLNSTSPSKPRPARLKKL